MTPEGFCLQHRLCVSCCLTVASKTVVLPKFVSCRTYACVVFNNGAAALNLYSISDVFHSLSFNYSSNMPSMLKMVGCETSD